MKVALLPPVTLPARVVIVPPAMSMRPPKLSKLIVWFSGVVPVTRSVDSAPRPVAESYAEPLVMVTAPPPRLRSEAACSVPPAIVVPPL